MVSFWVDPSTTTWKQGLVKYHMSASRVESTYLLDHFGSK